MVGVYTHLLYLVARTLCCCCYITMLLSSLSVTVASSGCVQTVNALPHTPLQRPTAVLLVPVAVAKHVILLPQPVARLLRPVCVAID